MIHSNQLLQETIAGLVLKSIQDRQGDICDT